MFWWSVINVPFVEDMVYEYPFTRFPIVAHPVGAEFTVLVLPQVETVAPASSELPPIPSHCALAFNPDTKSRPINISFIPEAKLSLNKDEFLANKVWFLENICFDLSRVP